MFAKNRYVTDIEDDSLAEGILMRDDIIMEINKKQINNTEDYDALVSGIKSDEHILILIFRKDSTLYITLSVK